jgi:hypothetical protein
MEYQKTFTREELAPQIATVEKFMGEHGGNGMPDLSKMMESFGPEAKKYYETIAARTKASAGEGKDHAKAWPCCMNPEGLPDIPCKCYQGSLKYTAAVKMLIEGN